jgi:hypothetical protein
LLYPGITEERTELMQKLIIEVYCSKCDTVWALPGKCRCDVSPKYEDVFLYTETGSIHLASWNAAIEAAADYADKEHSVRIGIEIRKLRK